MEKRELLARISIFSGLAPRALDDLVGLTTTRRLEPREVLFRKGDAGRQLHAVMSGRLRVSAAAADGKEVVFTFLDPGEVFGEIAVLDAEPRSATVVAVERSEVLSLHRRDLLPFLERHPRAALELAQVMARRVRRLSGLMEDAVFLSFPSRLAKKLVALADAYGKPTPEGERIDMRLPQHELGELVGTSRESVNKQMRIWLEQGLVRVDRGYITLVDRPGLESIAETFLL